MSAATNDIFSDSILNRIHSLYLHRHLHYYYLNVIEVDSFYSIALFSNEPVLVTKVRWFLHEGRVMKRVYWVELKVGHGLWVDPRYPCHRCHRYGYGVDILYLWPYRHPYPRCGGSSQVCSLIFSVLYFPYNIYLFLSFISSLIGVSHL